MTIPRPLSEAEVAPQVLQAMTASGCRIYRNNVGCAKFGARWIQYGVGGKGASDYIGYLPVRITPEMVGYVLAVFVAPETKAQANADYTAEQILWRDNVLAAGGIAGFCHSWEQGRKLVMDFYARFKTIKKVARKIKKA